MIKKIILLNLVALAFAFSANSQNYFQSADHFTYPQQFLLQSGSLSTFLFPGNDSQLKNAQDFASLADSTHQSKYDTIALNFKLTTRTFFEHDSGGLLIQKLTISTDKSGNWKNFSNDTLSYTGFLLNKVISQQWDAQLSTWNNKLKYDYLYDTLNVLQSIIISNWSTSSSIWEFSEKQSFVYNPAGKITQEMQQTWNSNITNWNNSSRTSYTYSGSNLTTSLNEHWDAVNLAWVNYTRTSYAYSAGLNTEALVEKYSLSSLSWENLVKNTYTYTTGGLKESQVIQLWETDHWANSIQYLNTYSGTDLTSVLTKQWQPHLNDWRNYVQDETYYSQHEIFGIRQVNAESILVKNPVEKGSQVRLLGLRENTKYELVLCDLNGKYILKQEIFAGDILSIPSTIAPGYYILTLQSRGKQKSFQKLLITD